MKILIINGPNINMLGIREPEIYGEKTYADLVSLIEKFSEEKGIDTEIYQSNSESEIVTKIQQAYKNADGIVINPAAYTHTSIAIADAIKAVGIPSYEVHISDVDQREEYRKISYVRDVCKGTVKGKGFDGYLEAINALID